MARSEVSLKSRLWQRAMIRAACSDTVQRFMQANPLTRHLARRYVGGADCAEALQKVIQLKEKGLLTSPYYLGEYVATPALVERNVSEIISAFETFRSATPSVFFCVDPTQIGYSISDRLGDENALRVAEETGGRPGIRFLMLDMEDASYVDRTIALYHRLRDKGVPVAITLQAYLRRTERDFERLASQGARIRLVKGAFVAEREIAWTKRREIDASYERLVRQALAPEVKAAGAYPIFATHDCRILDTLKLLLQAHGWQADQYEIEMLLGVRESLQVSLAREGYTVRVYVPFGTAWWAYTARRIGENPANARFILRSLWGG